MSLTLARPRRRSPGRSQDRVPVRTGSPTRSHGASPWRHPPASQQRRPNTTSGWCRNCPGDGVSFIFTRETRLNVTTLGIGGCAGGYGRVPPQDICIFSVQNVVVALP